MNDLLAVLLLATLTAGDSNNTCGDVNITHVFTLLSLFPTEQTCQRGPPKLQVLPGMRIRACQEAGHDNCPIHNVNVLSSSHCVKLCEILTSCCRLFTYNAQLGQCYIYDQDFYTSWTSVELSDGNWTTYYKQRDDGWKLLYKISKGINVDAIESYVSTPGQPFASQNLLEKDATCGCYVKSQVVDNWSRFPITQVSVSLATDGLQVKQLTFSGVGETSTSFFKHRNILTSSWTDLNASSTVWYMSLNQLLGNRGFLIVKTPFAGCSSDVGWLSVFSRGEATCNYDTKPVPSIAYAAGSTVENLANNAAYADALMIYAKM